MRIQRGEKLEYLGMYLDFSTKGKFKMSMIPYTQEVTGMFLEELNVVVKNPAA